MAGMGEFSLTAVGSPANQEFITRIPVAAGASETSFQQDTQKALLQILEGKYGQGQIILKSTEFVGARMAQSLASQTIWLVLMAVLLILLYMTFRFHPWIYAAAAVLGILHDALVMLSFDAVFRVEIDAGTIAAILTILGYSINDTIVNFDRARENNTLMRGESIRTILDTSVTQTLSRTFITSGATLLTVIALFILTSGTIRNFALNMIVGIVEGTYSTFISAFIVIEWTKWRAGQAHDRRAEEVRDRLGGTARHGRGGRGGIRGGSRGGTGRVCLRVRLRRRAACPGSSGRRPRNVSRSPAAARGFGPRHSACRRRPASGGRPPEHGFPGPDRHTQAQKAQEAPPLGGAGLS